MTDRHAGYMIGKTKNIFLFTVYLVFFTNTFASSGYARFNERIPEKFEHEVADDPEAWNDEISYRWPSPWHSIWNSAKNGVRISSGSLDANYFLFQREIKLFHREQNFSIAYGESLHDFNEFKDETREVEGTYLPTDHLGFGILLDGASEKKWYDVGFSLRLINQNSTTLTFKYWIVDPYYDSKETNTENSYDKKPYSTVIEARHFFGNTELQFFREYDSPLTWNRTSEGYEFFYERTETRWAVTHRVSPFSSVTYQRSLLKLNEQKTTAFESTNERKLFERHLSRHSVKSTHANPESSYQYHFGAEYLEYRAFLSSSSTLESQESAPPTESEIKGLRNEKMLFFEVHIPAFNNDYAQFGLHMNKVHMNLVDDIERLEQKLQVAYDLRIQKGIFILFNTTWDLDRIWENYPYSDEDFKPWGGGALQLMAIF